jgi:hypothetical protein
MSITIKRNKKPIVPVCQMVCDKKIHPKLDKYELTKFIGTLKPEGPKIEAVIPTKNGYHLITGKFDVKTFSEQYPSVDIQKKNPTLLFLPNSLN